MGTITPSALLQIKNFCFVVSQITNFCFVVLLFRKITISPKMDPRTLRGHQFNAMFLFILNIQIQYLSREFHWSGDTFRFHWIVQDL